MIFSQWNSRGRRLANALSGLGLRKGDRIAILFYNCDAEKRRREASA